MIKRFEWKDGRYRHREQGRLGAGRSLWCLSSKEPPACPAQVMCWGRGYLYIINYFFFIFVSVFVFISISFSFFILSSFFQGSNFLERKYQPDLKGIRPDLPKGLPCVL